MPRQHTKASRAGCIPQPPPPVHERASCCSGIPNFVAILRTNMQSCEDGAAADRGHKPLCKQARPMAIRAETSKGPGEGPRTTLTQYLIRFHLPLSGLCGFKPHSIQQGLCPARLQYCGFCVLSPEARQGRGHHRRRPDADERASKF
jgi:hypothetical protein